ncbi:glycosyltransferase [Agromyces atrinae]|uniref:GT2 family glycosyltransferase n=1 Tax=Agromyces atrinae TaxID=592376 RepID=A0A4V1R1X3_9MICO|nr:glycosyltransferase family 2 protein [Agromyces atrinae]NYD68412.1 GT2 family glycosyltransferase [Agromyces atrinae]RXZ85156.1 glycosyltransferase family 2 protein [Agromyces atrinae]
MSERLAVIVVNYASSGLLATNLAQTAAELPDAAIVVVDNFSTDDERRRAVAVCAEHAWTLLTPDANLGFGGGVNLGVRQALAAGATAVLLLNPDATIDAASVALLEAEIDDGRLVAAAPRIVDSDGAVWFAGADLYLDDGTTRGRSRRDLHPDAPRREWLTGACVLVTDVAWEASGGFDEEYFLYWEDVDFSFRIVDAGGRLALVEAATAIHDEGGTQRADAAPSRAKSSGYYYYNIRNRMLFATRHLDADGVRRWRRGIVAQARAVLLRGGRRQFLSPWAPLSAGWRGVRDARRIAATARR